MFYISLILITVSSLLFTTLLGQKNNNFLYFLLISFSQIILNFEILSLFSIINTQNFLILNIILTVILLILVKNKKPNILFDCSEIKKIISAIKKDEILAFTSICFCLFLAIQMSKTLFSPVSFGDALSYYLPRCTTWIQNGNLNHFITPDTRELVMPFNMELLYSWILMFRKSEFGIASFSYIGFIVTIYVLYNLQKEFNFSIRRRLWSIFIFSSFALVSIEMITPCADLFIGGLILTSIYLFLFFIKQNSTVAMFFSTLSFALAMGTKTTALIAIPSVFLIILIINCLYKKEDLKKNFIKYCAFLFINFLIFSSYNYILNIIQFQNPLSSNEQFLLNQFRGGFKGWLCNLIKYCFAIFDISGIKDYMNFNGFITHLQSLTLNLIGETDKSYTSPYFSRYFYFNSAMIITNSALGIMGLFVFLPSIFKSIKKLLSNKKREIIIAIFGLSLILNIMIFSRVMVFTQYNMRYILTFVVIASPIIALSYIRNNKNLYKILLCVFMFIYFIINPNMPTPTRQIEEQIIYNYFKNKDKCKIALITEQATNKIFYIEKLKLNDYKIEKLLLENIEAYQLENFDYIITSKNIVTSTNIINFNDRIQYPTLFVSKCVYFDKNQRELYSDNLLPVMVKCEVPFSYIYEKNFELEKDVKSNNYLIFKNIR